MAPNWGFVDDSWPRFGSSTNFIMFWTQFHHVLNVDPKSSNPRISPCFDPNFIMFEPLTPNPQIHMIPLFRTRTSTFTLLLHQILKSSNPHDSIIPMYTLTPNLQILKSSWLHCSVLKLVLLPYCWKIPVLTRSNGAMRIWGFEDLRIWFNEDFWIWSQISVNCHMVKLIISITRWQLT